MFIHSIVNINKIKAQDLLHKYQQSVEKQKKQEKDNEGRVNQETMTGTISTYLAFIGMPKVSEEDTNVTLMIKYRTFNQNYMKHVQMFGDEIKKLDATTAQTIEMASRQAEQLNKVYKDIEQRVNMLYMQNTGQTQGGSAISDAAKSVSDSAYALDQNMSKFTFCKSNRKY